MSVGGGVVAVAVGVFVFADQLGLGNKAAPEKPAVTQGSNPTQNPAKASDPTTPKAGETPAAQLAAKKPEIAPDKEPVTEPVKEVAQDPQSTTAEPSASAPEKAAEADAKPKPEVTGPTFDVVRVEPNGETLVAGKASPGWKVELKNGEKVLAKAVADVNGDWVMVLEKALDKGVSDLSLSGTSKDGTSSIASTSNVTVALPEDGSGEVLVVETAPGQASKILAKLAAPKTEAPNVEDPAKAEQQVAAAAPQQPVAPTEAAKSQPDTLVTESKDKADPASAPEGAKTPVEAVKDKVTTPDTSGADIKPATPTAELVKQDAKSDEKPKDGKPEPASVDHLVSIEAVEIEGDVLFVAGAAEPAGSIVRLYVDNRAVSDQRSGETGRYLFDGKLKLDIGEHRARVDLLDTEGGIVAKRAEVVFTKKAPAATGSEGESSVVVDAKPVSDANSAAAPTSETTPASSLPVKTKKVIIRRGDNLWEIARRVYGAGVRYSTIYDTNIKQIRNPNLIYPGQVFELPEGEDGWERNFDAVEAPPEEPADGSATPANGG